MAADGLWKTHYLHQNLSHRARGKDLENYVIHAIWNRVADLGIKPVAQQLIRLKSGSYSRLDLYFPQVRVAIECDEHHHKNQTEQDLQRTVGIIDALRSVDETELAEDIIRITLSDFENESDGDVLFDQELTAIADTIRHHAVTERGGGSWKEWTENRPDPFDYFKERSTIEREGTVVDDVGFGTIAEAHQSLFQSSYRGIGSIFNLSRYHPEYEGYWMSFGKTNLDFGSGRLGWNNVLSKDGKTLYERNEVSGPGDFQRKIDHRRVWFLKDYKRVAAPDGGGNPYRFIGVFEHVPGPDDTRVWRLVDEKLPLHATNREYKP